MKKILSLLLILCNLPTAGAQHASNFTYAPAEIIIKLNSERAAASFFPSFLDSTREMLQIISSKPIFAEYHAKLQKAVTKDFGLTQIYKLSLSAQADITTILRMLQNNPEIEYAQLNHIFQLDSIPNDSYINQQWLIKKIQLDQAWEIERGSQIILIGLVDTGVDYQHEDLSSNLWLNSGEDLNHNGSIDSSDFNNVDDDHNGYIDDLRGWDFTDAPHFPDGGDYLNCDNDPMDEHGHGTSIAGIVSAVADNHIGIAGIAHGCRIINLRAGTAQGLLEEDDVASAIVYAVNNDARIINMSFGDVVASPLLHDVIQYAYFNNCILVASAGNSATTEIHYPSGYNETISIGATTAHDVLAGFSNYGSTIDLVAPGTSLFTTKLNNHYGEFSGTSASAPVVSAVAALVLSHNPNLTNEDVKNILITSTDDLGSTGWDDFYGAGRVNALKALQINIVSEAKISSPHLDDGFYQSPITISGTASGALLDNYQLFYGEGDYPQEWFLIKQVSQRQVINGSLGQLNFSALPDSNYIVRLRVNNKDGSAVEDRTRIFIDRTSPQISNIKTTSMIDGEFTSVLIEFATDDLCQSSIFYRQTNSSDAFQEIKLNYITQEHRFNFGSNFGWGELNFYILATNQSGLQNTSDNHAINLTNSKIPSIQFMESDYHLPPGYMLNKLADFDADGNKEIIVNEFGLTNSYDRLAIYEFNNNELSEVYRSDRTAIPRDWGDSDNDGLPEILAGVGPISFIYESSTPNTFPNSIAWLDSSDFWASRFSDVDNDGRTEIIGRIGNTFTIWECNGDNNYSQIASLENPTTGINATGVPHTEIGDFDGDSLIEILIGDYDGDVYIYESQGDNTFRYTWSQQQPLLDCIDYISSGDYDGDGITEFVVGCHSSPELKAEHEYDARHWIFRIYKTDGDDSFSPVWEQPFFGYEEIYNSSNGMSSGDVDNDSRDEVLINIFPDFYIIDFDSARHRYYPQWYFNPTQSEANIIGDINSDGDNEFFINTGMQITGFKIINNNADLLPAPSGFKALPLDTNQIKLIWNSVSNATEYLIFKGKSLNQLLQFYQTAHTEFLDTLVAKDSTYWYAICANGLAGVGRKTQAISVTPNEKPYLIAAEFMVHNQLRLIFSEPMTSSINDVTSYLFSDNLGYPSSVIITKSSNEAILTLEATTLTEGTFKVIVINVYDITGTPIDATKNWALFEVQYSISPPYLIKAELTAPGEISLFFSQPLDPVSAIKLENYSIEPNVIIDSATLNSADSNMVILSLNNDVPMGALGKNYIITVVNVKNKFDVPIKSGQGSQAALIFYREDLSQVFTYPNPYCFTDGPGHIMFANLTKQATIKILTSTGELIRELQETDGNGGVEWDLKDENGKFVSSGIYIYYVQGADQSKIGKFALIK